MTGEQWKVTVQHLADPLRTYNVAMGNPHDAVTVAIGWLGARVVDYSVTVRQPDGETARYAGAAYLINLGPEQGTPCVECGGPCSAVDAVADDSGLVWCGSVYGNGCGDRGRA